MLAAFGIVSHAGMSPTSRQSPCQWSSLEIEDEGSYRPKDKIKNVSTICAWQHLYLFDYWAEMRLHLLLLMSSMPCLLPYLANLANSNAQVSRWSLIKSHQFLAMSDNYQSVGLSVGKGWTAFSIANTCRIFKFTRAQWIVSRDLSVLSLGLIENLSHCNGLVHSEQFSFHIR